MRRVAILGATGSIGQSALSVVAAHPDKLRVVALAAGENIARFVEQVAAFAPDTIAMSTPRALADACHALGPGRSGTPVRALSGADGLIEVATHPDADIVLFGIAGDLFESLLKRSAGVKDSSALIPGHGGILDRIDSWLFAAPVYFVVLRYV